MLTRQRFDFRQIADFRRAAILTVEQNALNNADPSAERVFRRHSDTELLFTRCHPGKHDLGLHGVHADNRHIAFGLVVEDPGFGLDIALHPAMTVEMVGSDVEQNSNITFEAFNQIELIGG